MAASTNLPNFAAAATIALAAAMLPSSVPTPAAAQGANPTVSDIIPEAAAVVIHAKIQAINPQARELTLAAADGRTVTVVAAPQVPLTDLKTGDRVNARYYRSVAFLVSKSMQVPKGQTIQLPPEQAELLQRQAQVQVPGGMSLRMIQVSGMVVGIRPSTQTVDVVNPTGGGVYTIQGSDPSRAAMVSALKIGDTVTAVVSPPIATTIEPVRGPLSDLRDLFNR